VRERRWETQWVTENPDRKESTLWRTIACQAAPPGWRLLSIFGQRRDVRPIAAWLVQERHRYTYTDEPESEVLVPPESDLEAKVGPETRVMPGIVVGGWGWEVKAIDLEGDQENWTLLGPGEADPTDEEWEAEIARRRA
jgi:hypothetical protein